MKTSNKVIWSRTLEINIHFFLGLMLLSGCQGFIDTQSIGEQRDVMVEYEYSTCDNNSLDCLPGNTCDQNQCVSANDVCEMTVPVFPAPNFDGITEPSAAEKKSFYTMLRDQMMEELNGNLVELNSMRAQWFVPITDSFENENQRIENINNQLASWKEIAITRKMLTDQITARKAWNDMYVSVDYQGADKAIESKTLQFSEMMYNILANFPDAGILPSDSAGVKRNTYDLATLINSYFKDLGVVLVRNDKQVKLEWVGGFLGIGGDLVVTEIDPSEAEIDYNKMEQAFLRVTDLVNKYQLSISEEEKMLLLNKFLSVESHPIYIDIDKDVRDVLMAPVGCRFQSRIAQIGTLVQQHTDFLEEQYRMQQLKAPILDFQPSLFSRNLATLLSEDPDMTVGEFSSHLAQAIDQTEKNINDWITDLKEPTCIDMGYYGTTCTGGKYYQYSDSNLEFLGQSELLVLSVLGKVSVAMGQASDGEEVRIAVAEFNWMQNLSKWLQKKQYQNQQRRTGFYLIGGVLLLAAPLTAPVLVELGVGTALAADIGSGACLVIGGLSAVGFGFDAIVQWGYYKQAQKAYQSSVSEEDIFTVEVADMYKGYVVQSSLLAIQGMGTAFSGAFHFWKKNSLTPETMTSSSTSGQVTPDDPVVNPGEPGANPAQEVVKKVRGPNLRIRLLNSAKGDSANFRVMTADEFQRLEMQSQGGVTSFKYPETVGGTWIDGAGRIQYTPYSTVTKYVSQNEMLGMIRSGVCGKAAQKIVTRLEGLKIGPTFEIRVNAFPSQEWILVQDAANPNKYRLILNLYTSSSKVSSINIFAMSVADLGKLPAYIQSAFDDLARAIALPL